MKTICICIICCILSVSCKKNNKEVNEDITAEILDSTSISKEDLKQINFTDIGLDIKTDKVMASWQPYITIADAVESLKQADFSFFTADIEVFNSAIKDLENTIPEPIKTQSIQARVLALKTQLLKLKGLVALQAISKKEKLLAVKEVFVAFSNLNLQINKKVEKDSQNIERPY